MTFYVKETRSVALETLWKREKLNHTMFSKNKLVIFYCYEKNIGNIQDIVSTISFRQSTVMEAL